MNLLNSRNKYFKKIMKISNEKIALDQTDTSILSMKNAFVTEDKQIRRHELKNRQEP